MTEFLTAVLILLPKKGGGGQQQPPQQNDKNTINVQFNPTSLRLQRQGSQLRSGMSAKDQQVQYPSTRAATLSFDLEFDTAEEFTGDRSGQGPAEPVDVRTKSQRIHQLVEPGTDNPAGAPNRVLFKWGTFEFQGVVTQLTEEFDYFAPNGTPLRSKMSLTIEEQNPKHEAKASGAGARTDETATQPGGAPAGSPLPAPGLQPTPGASPGRSGTADPRRNVPAQQGESVQQLAARLGGDPAAWRALMTDLTSPVGLPAGTSVVVGPEFEAPAAIGRALGFAAGVAQSPEQVLATALGLPSAGGAGIPPDVLPTASVSGAASPTEAAGFALAAAGGLAAATRTVVAAQTAAAVRAERSAFAVPAQPTGLAPTDPTATDVDPRALSYGRSLPLRSRVHTQTSDDARTGGPRSIAGRAQPAELPVSSARSAIPWERLPPAAAGRAAADRAQRVRDARFSTMRWKPGGVCR
jgi:hypothetical protein